MTDESDPFHHHPELRELIGDPLTSPMRRFSTEQMLAKAEELGLPTGWWHSDAEREADRAETLKAHPGGDLWVFAYGSLMWDPAFRFAEVRHARVAGHARRFILKDIYGGRGDEEKPGLMAALDQAACDESCDGLAFRIAAPDVDLETEVLWRREKIGPAYHAVFVDAQTADASIRALTFIADHGSDMIAPDITRGEQVRYLATGVGFLGTSLDYLRNVARKLDALDIRDDDVAALLREAEAAAE